MKDPYCSNQNILKELMDSTGLANHQAVTCRSCSARWVSPIRAFVMQFENLSFAVLHHRENHEAQSLRVPSIELD